MEEQPSSLVLMGKELYSRNLIDTLVDEEGIRRIDLSTIGEIDPDVLSLVPSEMAQRYRLIPFALEGSAISVVTSNPFDLYAQKAVEVKTNAQPSVYFASDEQIEEWISRLYFQDTALAAVDEKKSDVELEEDFQEAELNIDLNHSPDDAPAIRLVNSILKQAIQDRASDIHIEPQEKSVKIRFRIDGILHEIFTLHKKYQSGVVSRIKIMAGLDIAERRVPQDGRIKLRIFGRSVDIRVSTLPTIYGEKVVKRILDKRGQSLNIEDLGLEPELREGFLQALTAPHGMILVTGPTGSGKTTTLYSALNHVNSPDKNIITVEDPVEYRLRGINQIQAQPEVGLTFAAGLRAILRQDPDVVMVGEIRDQETAEIAIRASLTGHLVFSTLHTNSGIATIMRLIDMGIDRYLICSAVSLIVAQRLVRCNCLHCIEPYEVEPAVLERFGEDREILDEVILTHGAGCEHCGGTGYSGRFAIFEFFYLTSVFRNLILKDASLEEIAAKAAEMKMETLQANGLRKVSYGLTTIEEILRVTTEA